MPRHKQRESLALKLVNLEQGRPTVPLALSRMQDAIRIARREGYAGVKFVHGYGSSGEGGVIRIAVQAELVRLARAGQVRAVVPGEDWRISDESSWALLQKHPELKQDFDLGRGNKGITIVIL